MKKLIVMAAIVAPLAAFASIESSAHNFAAATTRAVSAGDQQICKYCHTPHGAIVGKQVLWNHQSSAKAYSWNPTSTFAGTALSAIVTDSAARCLACHDGTVAVGSVHNPGGNANPTSGAFSTVAFQGNVDVGGLLTGNNKLPDLAGNHPVGVPYPTSGAAAKYNGVSSGVDNTKVGQAGYYAVAAAGYGSHMFVGTLPLARPVNAGEQYGVECATCHNPHNTQNQVYLLRMPLAGSQLCLNCHLK